MTAGEIERVWRPWRGYCWIDRVPVGPDKPIWLPFDRYFAMLVTGEDMTGFTWIEPLPVIPAPPPRLAENRASRRQAQAIARRKG